MTNNAGEPIFYTARHRLENKRQSYNRDVVNTLETGGWGVVRHLG